MQYSPKNHTRYNNNENITAEHVSFYSEEPSTTLHQQLQNNNAKFVLFCFQQDYYYINVTHTTHYNLISG